MPAHNVSTQFISIGSGQMITSAFEVGRARDMAVVWPTVDAANAFVLGGLSATGPFTRMGNQNSAALLVGTGSFSAVFTGLVPMPYGKFEFTVSQAAVRSMTVISRL